MVALIQKMDHHTLSFFNLWHQYNEHRIFFPLLVLMLNAYLTHWNTISEVIINFCFASLTATLIVLFLKRTFNKLGVSVVAAMLVAAWFFSLIQWENWLWGWQLEWFMCVFGAIASIFLLTKQSELKNDNKNKSILFLLAILSGIISTYSLSAGIVVWLVGLFILVSLKQSKKYIITWSVTSIAAIALYYYHYTVPIQSDRLTASFFMHHIDRFGSFFLTYLGASVGYGLPGSNSAMLTGVMLLLSLFPLLYFVWRDKKNFKKYLPWLSLMMFSLLCGLTITVGRLFLGTSEALASRYTTLSILYIIGITVLPLAILDNKRCVKKIRIPVTAGIFIISFFLLFFSYKFGFIGFQERSTTLHNVKTCTSKPDPSNACLSSTYPIPAAIRQKLQFLKTKGLAGY